MNLKRSVMRYFIRSLEDAYELISVRDVEMYHGRDKLWEIEFYYLEIVNICY